MRVTRSCSWCHMMNEVSERWCEACGHAAHKPRLVCDCTPCLVNAALADGAVRPLPDMSALDQEVNDTVSRFLGSLPGTDHGFRVADPEKGREGEPGALPPQWGPPPFMAGNVGMAPNPKCHCTSATQAMLCEMGHLTECHYGLTCREARCSHLARYQ